MCSAFSQQLCCATVQPAHVVALRLRSLLDRRLFDLFVTRDSKTLTVRFKFARRGLQVGQTTLNHSAYTLNWNANCIAWDNRHCHSILMTNTYSSWGLNLQNCGCVIADLLTSDFGHIDNWRQKYCLIFLKSAKLIIYLQLHPQLQTTLDVQKAFCWTGSIKATQLSLISWKRFYPGIISHSKTVSASLVNTGFYWNRHSS